jgi:hypothetical protein
MWEFRWVLFENVLLQIEQVGIASSDCAALPLFGVWNNSEASSAVLALEIDSRTMPFCSTRSVFFFETPDLRRIFFDFFPETLDFNLRILSDSWISSVSDALWLSSKL